MLGVMPPNPNVPIDVCLVVPPVLYKSIPAFGVSILKSCLTEAGFSCVVDYANHPFAEAMGDQMGDMYKSGVLEPLAEYIFNSPAGIDSGYSPEEAVDCYADTFVEADLLSDDIHEVDDFRARALAAVEKGIVVAAEQTETTAQRIVSLRPKVVGCSSTFAQRNASLGILRRIKELDPGIITLMGGYNTTGPAGLAMLRRFKFIDCVLFGEGDDIIAEVVSRLLSGDTSNMPYGAVMNSGNLPPVAPHRIVKDLDSTPIPDFDDYFAQSQDASPCVDLSGNDKVFALPTEASRGCWWGEKSPCKFCGVCGRGLEYRVKSPEKVVEHMLALNERYGVTYFDLTDSILPHQRIDELISLITECGQDFHLAGMIKANIGNKQLEAMAKAGWVRVLPGIESLSDSFLKNVGKGVRASQCVALLKNAKRAGIDVSWNLLYGAPGDTDEQYEEELEVIPKLEHLKAPNGAFLILYARDSVYELNRDEYGLDLVPLEATRVYCPQDEDYVRDVTKYYQNLNEAPLTPRRAQLRKQLSEACAQWSKDCRSEAQRLDMARIDDSIMIYDSRRCRTSTIHTLKGPDMRVYELADQPITHETLVAELGDIYVREKIDEAIQGLLDRNLMVYVSGCYISLALPMGKTAFILNHLVK